MQVRLKLGVRAAYEEVCKRREDVHVPDEVLEGLEPLAEAIASRMQHHEKLLAERDILPMGF